MYQDDNGLFDVPDPHSNMHDMLNTAAWTFAGAMLGSKLDNTRFGYWFNTSKVVGIFFNLIKVAILGLAGFYIYCVIQVW